MAPMSLTFVSPVKMFSIVPYENVHIEKDPVASSMNLCTEILGSENGVTYPLEDTDSSILEKEEEDLLVKRKTKRTTVGSRCEFPPPLTTLGGGARLRLSTRRAEGRLVLVPFVPEVLEADRSNEGRLRIQILPCGPHHRSSTKEASNGECKKFVSVSRCKEEDGVGAMMMMRMRKKGMMISDVMLVSTT